MRKAILLALVFSALSVNAQTMFQKTVGTLSNDRNYNLAVMHDGGLVATGYTQSSTPNVRDAFLLKYDRFGEVEWAKTYGGAAHETIWDVIVTQDNHIVGAGHSASLGANTEGVIARCDSLGNVLWATGAGSPGRDVQFYSVMETSAGQLIVAGLLRDNHGDDMLICKFSPQGILLWSRIIGSADSDEIMGITETAQGDYLFAGLTGKATDQGGESFAVVKTDTTGKVIWKKSYGSQGDDRLNDVMELDNAYYFLGWSEATAVGNRDAVVMKTDTAGNVIWVNAYGTPETERAFNMLYHHDREAILIAGYTDYSPIITSNRNTFLLSIDTAANIHWVRGYGSTQTDGHWPTGLAQNDDAGYYVFSSTNSFGPNDMSLHLTKTDTAGHTACHEKTLPFIRQELTGWSGMNFGSDSVVTLTNTAIPLSGVNWVVTPSTQCCLLYAFAGKDTGVCPGSTTMIGSDGIPGYTYSWTYNNNVAGNQPWYMVSPDSVGVYVLTVEVPGSACAAQSDSLWVSAFPAPQKPVVTYVPQQYNMLQSSVKTNIQWFFNGTIMPGDTHQVLHAYQDGYYHVVAYNEYGCETASDSVYHLVNSSKNQKDHKNAILTVFPNPTSGNLYLRFHKDIPDKMEVMIYDPKGRLIYEQQLNHVKKYEAISISLNNQAEGVCHLVVKTVENTWNFQVVILR